MGSYLAFSPRLADSVRRSDCRYIVTGASGWLGKATLEMLGQALGEGFAARVTALGSRQMRSSLANGQAYPVEALQGWQLPCDWPAIVFHYAFLTKDKVGSLSNDEYVARNEAISKSVRNWINTGDVRGVVMPSSGAVYDVLHSKTRDSAAQPYGQLKYNDELAFRAACESKAIGLIIPRVFNLSGPYINKFDSYALSSFIHQALRTRSIVIQARRPVIRSYYFVGDLIELCLRLLFRQTMAATECFDVAGDEIVELNELARRVTVVLADQSPVACQRLPMLDDAGEDRYVGNRDQIKELEMLLGMHPMSLDDQIKATRRYIESATRLDYEAPC